MCFPSNIDQNDVHLSSKSRIAVLPSNYQLLQLQRAKPESCLHTKGTNIREATLTLKLQLD